MQLLVIGILFLMMGTICLGAVIYPQRLLTAAKERLVVRETIRLKAVIMSLLGLGFGALSIYHYFK